GGAKREYPVALRIAISSLESTPVTVLGSVKRIRPSAFTTRPHSRSTRARSGRWSIASASTKRTRASTPCSRAMALPAAMPGALMSNPAIRAFRARDEERGPARAAADLEQAHLRPQAQPLAEGAAFLGGQPAVLADVLTEGFPSHAGERRLVEVAVGRVVQ